MEIRHAYLVIADISGYTRFVLLHTTSLLHAEAIISELLEAVIATSDHPLTIAKLEGDAVFLYALADEAEAIARDILMQATNFFDAFRTKERSLIACNTCGCPACRTIAKLHLKVVVHHGEVAVKQVRDFTELAGSNVILIHRLLKNSISAREYLLMTQTFSDLSKGDTVTEMESRIEHADGIGDVRVKVHYPRHSLELPARPAPTLPKPGTDSAAFYDHLNAYAKQRLNGTVPAPKFSSLPELQINLLSRIGYAFGKFLPKMVGGLLRLFGKNV